MAKSSELNRRDFVKTAGAVGAASRVEAQAAARAATTKFLGSASAYTPN